jgi:hypothetical protein
MSVLVSSNAHAPEATPFVATMADGPDAIVHVNAPAQGGQASPGSSRPGPGLSLAGGGTSRDEGGSCLIHGIASLVEPEPPPHAQAARTQKTVRVLGARTTAKGNTWQKCCS